MRVCGCIHVLQLHVCVRVHVYSSGRVSVLLSGYLLCLAISLCRPFTVSPTPRLTSTTGPSV